MKMYVLCSETPGRDPIKCVYKRPDPFGTGTKLVRIKATSHLTIFMCGTHTKGKIQRNNYQDVQCRPFFEGKTSSISLIAPTHAQRIAE